MLHKFEFFQEVHSRMLVIDIGIIPFINSKPDQSIFRIINLLKNKWQH